MPHCREVDDRAHLPGGRAWLVMLLLVVFGPLLGGCAAVRVTDPPRTATEQFLISEAASRAVQQVSAAALRDRLVYIEDRFFASIDKPLVVGELRSHLLLNGVRLAESREQGQIVLELRTHGVGIDRYDYLLGLPPVLIPADTGGVDDVTAAGAVVTPELAILKNVRQRSFASVAFVAYWGDTGEVVASSGPFLGAAEREDWWFFGVGPRTTGDIPPVDPDE